MKLTRGDIRSDIKRWLKSYYRYLERESTADNTMQSYQRILGQLEPYVSTQDDLKTIKDINREIILDFIDHLEDEYKKRVSNRYAEFSMNTKTLYIAILKSFFIYIGDNADPENDAYYTFEREFKKLFPKKLKKAKKIKHIEDKDYDRIIDYLDERIVERGSHYDYVNSMGIKMMLIGGLRAGEALKLTLDCFKKRVTKDTKEKYYEVRLENTKTEHEQHIPILAKHIEEEMRYFKSIWDKEEEILKGKKSLYHVSRSNFYVTVNNIYKKAGVNKKGLHIARHTAAMRLLESTGDITLVKQLLRHTNIATTMIYLKRDTSDLASKLV